MKKRIGKWKDFVFIIPSLLGVTIFVFIPFCDVIRRSFTNIKGDRFVGLGNYSVIFTNAALKLATRNTGRFILICVPMLLILSLLLAILIFFSGKDKYKGIFLFPMAVPIVSLVFVWKMIFHSNGLINSWFGTKIDWIESSSSFGVLVASFIWKNIGYYVVLWIAGLSGIPKELYEAAGIDGAGMLHKFVHITLPGLKPIVSITCVLALTSSLKSYREAYLLAGEYPNESMYMIQHIFHNWFRELSSDKMCASAVVIVLIFIIIVYPFRKRGSGNAESME
jgi:multiple sugar transport system permease protein